MASYEEAKAARRLPERGAADLAASVRQTLLAGTNGFLAAQEQMLGAATAQFGGATFGATVQANFSGGQPLASVMEAVRQLHPSPLRTSQRSMGLPVR